MFTAAIRIDRPIKRQVGRTVIGDDPARDLGRDMGAQQIIPHLLRPSVRVKARLAFLIAPGGIATGAARPDPQAGGIVSLSAIDD